MGDGGLVNSLGYVRNRSVILHIDRFWTLQNDVSTNFDANCVVDCLEPVTKRTRLYSRNQSQKKY